MSLAEKLHPGHHSVRLKGRDYSELDIYFVTVCAHQRKCIFGKIADGKVQSSSLGQLVRECWVAIPAHFARVKLHEFVIMPNHVHGLIEIGCQAGAQHAAPLRVPGARPAVRAGSLGAIVRSFKAAVTFRARRELGWKEEVWQRNYFERVLRSGRESADATRYIAENPIKWEWDRENAEAKSAKLGTEIEGAQHAAPLREKPWN